jgi:Protein of unknown function (DUF2852)
MGHAATLHDIGKPVWIVGMILGFMWWWPVGLLILASMLWSGRMGAWRHWHGGGCWGYAGRWRNADNGGNHHERPRGPTSGNRAFDEYRADTLRRLEDEQRDFVSFLDRLRMAKDKAEFDQFMAERRERPSGPEAQPQS